MARYVVTEIEGYNQLNCSQNSRVGLSCMVIDTLTARQSVATFRTEDLNGNRWRVRTQAERCAIVREQAATRCDLLNRLDEIARGVAAA